MTNSYFCIKHLENLSYIRLVLRCEKKKWKLHTSAQAFRFGIGFKISKRSSETQHSITWSESDLFQLNLVEFFLASSWLWSSVESREPQREFKKAAIKKWRKHGHGGDNIRRPLASWNTISMKGCGTWSMLQRLSKGTCQRKMGMNCRTWGLPAEQRSKPQPASTGFSFPQSLPWSHVFPKQANWWTQPMWFQENWIHQTRPPSIALLCVLDVLLRHLLLLKSREVEASFVLFLIVGMREWYLVILARDQESWMALM